jgi:hypothetical protein
MNLKTNLLGKTVSISGDASKPGRLYQIAAVWLADGHEQPTATLLPLDPFGRPEIGKSFGTAKISSLITQ